MSKKIISYVLTLAMIFSVFCNPALGYATTEAETSAVTETTAVEEPSSNEDTAVTDEEPSDGEEQTEQKEQERVPSVGTVTGLKASAVSYNTIRLKWKKVKGAAGYYVYRYSKTKDRYILQDVVKGTSYKNKKLFAGRKYSYKVRAYVKKDGKRYKGKFSKIVRCKTKPYVPKVTAVSAKANSCSAITVKWKKVKGASGYQLYRYNKVTEKYRLVKTVTKNSYKNTGLKDDTKYSYKVRAYKVQDGKKYYGGFSEIMRGTTEMTDQNKVKALAYSKRNCQYKWGGKGPKKFDCSGFVYWVYDNADVKVKKAVPNTSSAGQYAALKKYMIGKSIKALSKAETGDIVFFKQGGRVCHVGIYYEDGKMIHAANPRKDIRFDKVKDYERWGFKVAGIARVL